MKKYALGLLALAAVGIGFSPGANANATLISIATGSTPSLQATDGGSGYALYNAVVGGNTSYSVTATGSPSLGFSEPDLDTTSVNVSTSISGAVLYVWITEQGLSSPLGVNSFLSGFTSNTWGNHVTSVTETTYLSTSNALYGGTVLATTVFTAASHATNDNDPSPSLSSPFSETAEYMIVFGDHGGTANDTIDISSTPIPEPMSLAILGVGLAGLGMVQRRRA